MDPTLAGLLRRADPDRFLTVLFAPAAARDILLALYAFNHELARAREVTREPGLALIRLQWWREVIEGEARPHEVATPLHAALTAGRLHAPDLFAMIEAREREAEDGFATRTEWQDWLLQGAGSLAVAAGRALGAPASSMDRLRALGAGYAVAGQLGNIAAYARQGRCTLPADVLEEHGLAAGSVRPDLAGPALQGVCAALARQGQTLLGRPERCAPGWIAASLPAVLAGATCDGQAAPARALCRTGSPWLLRPCAAWPEPLSGSRHRRSGVSPREAEAYRRKVTLTWTDLSARS